MRRIVAFDNVSADGYFAAADGSLGWVVPEPAIDDAAASGSPTEGVMLFGRKTYEMFESFWPQALEDARTAPDPHVPGRRTPALRRMAEWINQARKLVFSRARKDFPWTNSHLLGAFEPAKVEALKGEPGGDVYAFGSGTILSLLTAHGLVDEYQLVVSPRLLGAGKNLLRGVPQPRSLELLEAKSFPSGVVLLRYAPAG